MSVFVRSPAEFGAIAATLRSARNSHEPLFPLSYAERWEYLALAKQRQQPPTEDEFRLSLIPPFVFRLYLANAMSHCYTYMKDGMKEFVIPLIDLPEGKILELPELLSELESLSYNLVTNGGNSFLGVRDDKKLTQLIAGIKSQLIRARYA